MREYLSPLPEAILRSPRWWVALSGGADSVALLHALVAYRETATAPAIHAIHVNHGLHADAPDWVALCQRHADNVGVPLEVAHCNIEPSGHGLESDARTARYAAFEAVVKKGEVLFTAHHADDMVETVMLRLLRGAGPRGLSGIPRHRICGDGLIFRPLLDTPGETLRSAVEAAGLDYVTDPSNLQTQQDRNYLRQVVLPAIAERWPGYRETVRRAAELQALTQQRLSTLPLQRTQTVVGEPAVAVDPTQDPAVFAAEIHQWLGELRLDAPDQRRLLEFARQVLTAAADRTPELVWDSACLRAWDGMVISVPISLASGASVSLPDEVVVGESLEGPWGSLSWEACEGAYGLLAGTTLSCIRCEQLATLAPLNRPSKPSKKWLQELRIPPWWRGHLPVLTRDSVPLWLFSAGSLQGLESSGAKAAEAGLKPIWRLFNAV